jgi:hypothetical protein
VDSIGHRSPSMAQILRPWLGLLVLATFALALIAIVMPGRAPVALHWYLVLVATMATLATMQAIVKRFPDDRRSRNDPFGRRPPEADEQPQRLREIERLVSYSRWSAADYDERLRPILYEIARQRLAAYGSIAIDTDPAAARTLLGERVWTLISPVQTGEPVDRLITIPELETVVTVLEGMSATARS